MIGDVGRIAARQDEPRAAGERTGDSTGPRPVTDRWLSDLIRQTAGAGSQPSEAAPAGMAERLRQAVRWGFQEREFNRFAAALPQRAVLSDYLSWALRRAAHSPAQLSRLTGLTAAQLQALEQAQLSPLTLSPEQMADLAAALDLSIWSILERLRAAEPVADNADAVWNAGAAQGDGIALRCPETARQGGNELAAYRHALHQAWRKRQRG